MNTRPSQSVSPLSPSPAGSGTAGRSSRAADPAEPAKPAYVGKRVGKFRLLSLLGQGTMGRVFRAEDVDLHRHVALKVIADKAVAEKVAAGDPAAAAGPSERVEQFLREARSAARLDHPHVVMVHEVGRAGPVHFIAMELVEGGNLYDLLKAGGPMDARRACQLCAEAAEALQYAHENGVLHRDVKPANLMLARGGRCKLADFGLARIDDPGDPFALTAAAVGTPLYAAPEVIRHTPATARSDVYSLGATLYHLLAGVPPFTAPTASQVMRRHLTDPTPNLLEKRPDLPASLADVVRRAMAKDPLDRYESAGQMAAVLRLHTVPVGGGFTPAAGLPPAAQPPSPWAVGPVVVGPAVPGQAGPGATGSGLAGLGPPGGSGPLAGITGSQWGLAQPDAPAAGSRADLGLAAGVPARPPLSRRAAVVAGAAAAVTVAIAGALYLASRSGNPESAGTAAASQPTPQRTQTAPAVPLVTPPPPQETVDPVIPPTPPPASPPAALRPSDLAVTDTDTLLRKARANKESNQRPPDATVVGVVREVVLSPTGNVYYVNFAEVGREGFMCAFFPRDAGRLSEAFPGEPGLPAWRGKRLRVTGALDLYQGRPEIVISRPSQVTVLP